MFYYNHINKEITNVDLYDYGYAKFFVYSGYGDNNILNKIRRKFRCIVCEVIDLYDNDRYKYYGECKKNLSRKGTIKMNFYNSDHNGNLVPLKYLKNKKINIKISEFNNYHHFHPYNILDYEMINRNIKLQKIMNKING